jgi:hypothetical protein
MMKNAIEPAVSIGGRLSRAELFNELAKMPKRFSPLADAKPEGRETIHGKATLLARLPKVPAGAASRPTEEIPIGC